jgi:Protein of unknown function (DUF1566)
MSSDAYALRERISMNRLYSILITMALLVSFVPTAALAAGFPTWSSKLTKGRFPVLPRFNSEAVFDKETGLVWEKSPNTGTFTWVDALAQCYTLEVGGRKGWRLPTIEELASLVDTSQSAPTLPAGHPFNVQSSGYWSATTVASNTSNAWFVGFFAGNVGDGGGKADINVFRSVWCVRGGQGIDGVQ